MCLPVYVCLRVSLPACVSVCFCLCESGCFLCLTTVLLGLQDEKRQEKLARSQRELDTMAENVNVLSEMLANHDPSSGPISQNDVIQVCTFDFALCICLVWVCGCACVSVLCVIQQRTHHFCDSPPRLVRVARLRSQELVSACQEMRPKLMKMAGEVSDRDNLLGQHSWHSTDRHTERETERKRCWHTNKQNTHTHTCMHAVAVMTLQVRCWH